MEPLHLALSVVSMLAFGWLGWRTASKKGRNAVGWMIAGVILPPLLLALLFLKPIEAPTDDAVGATNESDV